MNISKLLSDVEKLHSRAAAKGFVSKNVRGRYYNFEFNGRNWCVTVADTGEKIAEFNTRSIGKATTWLREYLDN